MDLIANVLKMKNISKAAVVHGDGFDEITPTGETKVILIKDGKLLSMSITPEDFGIKRCTHKDLQCKNLEDAIKMMEQVLDGEGPQPIKDMVALNLGMAIFLLEDEISLKDAVERAKSKTNQGIDRRRFIC